MSTWSRPPFVVVTDKAKLQFAVIHEFLSGSYWAAGIPEAIVRKAIDRYPP